MHGVHTHAMLAVLQHPAKQLCCIRSADTHLHPFAPLAVALPGLRVSVMCTQHRHPVEFTVALPLPKPYKPTLSPTCTRPLSSGCGSARSTGRASCATLRLITRSQHLHHTTAYSSAHASPAAGHVTLQVKLPLHSYHSAQVKGCCRQSLQACAEAAPAAGVRVCLCQGSASCSLPAGNNTLTILRLSCCACAVSGMCMAVVSNFKMHSPCSELCSQSFAIAVGMATAPTLSVSAP
jgi:hypothetical protein